LVDWLHQSDNCRATVIAADAGYGKTTLAWQWEREVDFPCYWYKLDRSDRDWSLHISYLIESISQRHAGFGHRTHSVLQQLGGPGSSRPGVAAYLLAEMHERLTEPCTFIIDDWQFVASVTEVRGLWNQILRDAPPTCRFLFLSRAKPQLQFARFKAHGGYAEMRTDSLRFIDREIDELFRDIYDDPLDATELAELERRTEGWAASLQLVEVSLRERKTPDERQSFIRSITAAIGTDLFSFLAEEVLDQQNDRVRDFLVSTSILQQISPELAERLAGVSDGGRMLAELEQRGLFTYRLDSMEGRYRYHGLFREFLERRLVTERSQGEVTGLHIHAASYFETHHQWPEAIHHYLRARLQPQAARLIARYGEGLVGEGRLGSVDEWLEDLPKKAIRENARLSLLYGEARGVRGEWSPALEALARARSFFARKGDRRMEALASLKLSTVHTSHGDVALAAAAASEGLELAPDDAVATRLRLQGNLAITSDWMESSLATVGTALGRIAGEAKARGWEHLEAIALHNLGMVQRHMGEIDESVRNLERAARFWSALPASPFADNAELVESLLASDCLDRAAVVAETAVLRTAPWPRPNAEALYGTALVHAYSGNFAEAIEVCRRLLQDPGPLGPTAELIGGLLIETMFLAGETSAEAHQLLTQLELGVTDPRQAPLIAPVRALVRHSRAHCRGECLASLKVLRQWDEHGAAFVTTMGLVKLGTLALAHGGARNERLAIEALHRARIAGSPRYLRWWLRRYAQYAAALARHSGAVELLLSMAEADPEGWRAPLLETLAEVRGIERDQILDFLTRFATRETAGALSSMKGLDVVEARRRIIQRQAPRLYVRSFGSITVHRGGWTGPLIPIDRRRMRTLLGLLVAYSGTTLTRDMALDIMWPDADPGAAVNSLNQTVFQLRRAIDPAYRDGESALYVISTVDSVQLNPDLVRTDLQEFRRLSIGNSQVSANAAALLELIRGEFLADLKYDDWASRIQTAVHAEVREYLLPLAAGVSHLSRDLSVRAACALVALDEFDEGAYVAMARQLAESGKRSAARDLITRFAERLQEEFAEPVPIEVAQLVESLAQNRARSTNN
jgi:DNA-binding SARP family transcriptional activator